MVMSIDLAMGDVSVIIISCGPISQYTNFKRQISTPFGYTYIFINILKMVATSLFIEGK